LKVLVDSIQATTVRAGAELAALAQQLDAATGRLVSVTEKLWAADDPTLALANASLYLEAAGHLVVAWMWLELALAAAGKSGDFYEGKRAAALYFFHHELPRIQPHLDVLESLDVSLVELDDSWL
jgi:butyryl-CoA dehydrogenase